MNGGLFSKGSPHYYIQAHRIQPSPSSEAPGVPSMKKRRRCLPRNHPFRLALLPVGCIVEFPLAVEQQIVGTLRSEPWKFEVIVLLHGGSRRIRHESSVRLFLAILKLSFVFYPFVGKWTDVNFGFHHLLHLFLVCLGCAIADALKRKVNATAAPQNKCFCFIVWLNY